jgi:polysaccharide biosynthesis protein PslJ
MESQTAASFKEWLFALNPSIRAIGLGLIIGIIGGLLGLLLAVLGPIVTIVIVIGVLGGLYVVTDTTPALYGTMALLIMLPFGTLPFKIGVTPTLLDIGLGAFVLVYLVQWVTGRRRTLRLVWPHALIALYLMWLIFAFVLGLRYGSPTSTILRQFAESLLSISMAFILVDLLSDAQTLRRLVLLIMALLGSQALIAIVLWAMPDTLAESLLVRLGRIGYPAAGVIRYIESNPELGERAIGTWVDPNALGGLLAIGAAMLTPQVFAQKPVLKTRWLTLLVLGTVVFALILTSSRSSFLAYSISLGVIAVLRYRRYIPYLLLGALLFLVLPQTQDYIDRILQAFQGADLATQMRLGEWGDSLELIQRYPVFGIGFTGTPTRDIYTDVANMYLIMANQIGLTGVFFFLLAMSGIFYYAWQAWKHSKQDAELDSIHLGYNIALLAALLNAVADLYFFRIDFQSSITWFWLIVALALASSRLVIQRSESTIEESSSLH